MGNPSKGNSKSLDPLHQTIKALKEIRTNLIPFLQLLKDDDESSSLEAAKKSSSTKKRGRPTDDNEESEDDKTQQPSKKPKLSPHKRAEAEAAVALAVGTLRYMGARLRGLDRGRKKGDPLRIELDKMRGMLVSLRKLEGDNKKKDDDSDDAKHKETKNNATKNADYKNNVPTKRKNTGGAEEVKSLKSSAKKKQRR